MKPKVSNSKFIDAVAYDAGFTKKEVADMLASAANIVLQNLKEGVATSILQGMVVYPSTYNNEITFPRARFGKFFKSI